MIYNKTGARHHRLLFGLVCFITAFFLWFEGEKLRLSSLRDSEWASRLGMSSEEVEMVPMLNTTWHSQMALEMRTDKTGLEAIQTPLGVLDRTRVALLMENRPLPYLIPLLLHYISVVPPEWSFRFMGSEESNELLLSNPTIRRYVNHKKLFIDLIPYDLVPDINSYSTVNHLLTRPKLYEEWLWPAEWLFLFQDDSMICSASKRTLNDFVDEGWSFMGVSSFGHEKPHSLGGGFSLRRVSHLIRQLRTYSFDQWAADGKIASEDYYFSMALWDLEGAKQPTGAEASRFGVVFEYHEDPDEMPLGYHPYSSNGFFRGKDGKKEQDKAYEYCPELAIITVGRWDCQCAPAPGKKPAGGLGG